MGRAMTVSYTHLDVYKRQVVELHSGPKGIESFVMASDGQLLGVTLTDSTYVLSWLDELSKEDFLSGSAPDVAVTVYFDGPKSRIVTGSGEEIESREAEAVYLTGFLKPAATVLADGTELDVWQYEHCLLYTSFYRRAAACRRCHLQ